VKLTVPFIEGYKIIRSDRVATTRGGGLVTFVRKSLVIEDLGKVALEATEDSTFRIQLAKERWITISNVYFPHQVVKGMTS